MSHDTQAWPAPPSAGGGSGTPAEPPAPARGREGLRLALAVVCAVLLMAVIFLTASLFGVRSAAEERAAAERVEAEQQAGELRDAQGALTDAERRLADAEAEADSLLALAAEAEAARAGAEEAAVPADTVLEEFLVLLRESDPAFSTVPDSDLIELGQSTCDHLDTFGNSEENFARLIDIGVASGIPADLSMQVTASAVVILCPQHKLD